VLLDLRSLWEDQGPPPEPKPQFWTPTGELHVRNPHGINAPGWGRRFLYRMKTRRYPWPAPRGMAQIYAAGLRCAGLRATGMLAEEA
jgi:hypothetical protein